MGQPVQVTKKSRRLEGSDDGELLTLFVAIASGDNRQVTRQLDEAPGLATRPVRIGATRQDPDPYFLGAIRHYLYAGDTALHVAAAAHTRQFADSLVTRGADVRARNRRGAEPLHYAADGSPRAAIWNPAAQQEVIRYLIEAGADPDAMTRAASPRCIAPFGLGARARSKRSSRTVRIRG